MRATRHTPVCSHGSDLGLQSTPLQARVSHLRWVAWCRTSGGLPSRVHGALAGSAHGGCVSSPCRRCPCCRCPAVHASSAWFWEVWHQVSVLVSWNHTRCVGGQQWRPHVRVFRTFSFNTNDDQRGRDTRTAERRQQACLSDSGAGTGMTWKAGLLQDHTTHLTSAITSFRRFPASSISCDAMAVISV